MIIETQYGGVQEVQEVYIKEWTDNDGWHHYGYLIVSNLGRCAYFFLRSEAEKELARFKKWLKKGARGLYSFKGTVTDPGKVKKQPR